MTAQAQKPCDVRCQATKANIPAKTQDRVACAVLCSHLQLLAKPLSPALGLLQGLASHLSIAHTHHWLQSFAGSHIAGPHPTEGSDETYLSGYNMQQAGVTDMLLTFC